MPGRREGGSWVLYGYSLCSFYTIAYITGREADRGLIGVEITSPLHLGNVHQGPDRLGGDAI
jgi:hypothetical protein